MLVPLFGSFGGVRKNTYKWMEHMTTYNFSHFSSLARLGHKIWISREKCETRHKILSVKETCKVQTSQVCKQNLIGEMEPLKIFFLEVVKVIRRVL